MAVSELDSTDPAERKTPVAFYRSTDAENWTRDESLSGSVSAPGGFDVAFIRGQLHLVTRGEANGHVVVYRLEASGEGWETVFDLDEDPSPSYPTPGGFVQILALDAVDAGCIAYADEDGELVRIDL